MQTVRIQTNQKTFKTDVCIGGVELKNVLSASYEQSVGEVPHFEFETGGYPSIAIDCPSVQFKFAPQTLSEAARVLRHSFLTDAELYKALVGSINSVLKPKERYVGDGEFEISAESGSYYLAEEIADRIIGKE